MTSIISGALFGLSVIVLDGLTQKYDHQRVLYRVESLMGCITFLTLIMTVFTLNNVPALYGILGLFFGGQFCAAVMDAKDMKVADIYHIWSFVPLIPLVILFFLSGLSFWNIVLFIILQIVFRLFGAYADSDVIAFVLMGLFIYSLGGTILLMIGAQLVSYILLFIPEMIGKNVNRAGNLKTVKPFIPYIFLSETIVLCVVMFL